jgi:hypothetical protein
LRYPEIQIDDELSFLSVRIAKMGFYGGDPDKVLKAPVTTIMNILAFERYEYEYQETFGELNDGSNK